MNPYMAVKVNGGAVTVPLGATVSTAIEAAGVKHPATVLSQLSVTRLVVIARDPLIQTKILTITADEMEWNHETGEILLRGNVRVKFPSSR